MGGERVDKVTASKIASLITLICFSPNSTCSSSFEEEFSCKFKHYILTKFHLKSLQFDDHKLRKFLITHFLFGCVEVFINNIFICNIPLKPLKVICNYFILKYP